MKQNRETVSSINTVGTAREPSEIAGEGADDSAGWRGILWAEWPLLKGVTILCVIQLGKWQDLTESTGACGEL